MKKTSIKRYGWLMAITLALSFTLAACGKKGSPEPPGPTSDIIYPRIYPAR